MHSDFSTDYQCQKHRRLKYRKDKKNPYTIYTHRRLKYRKDKKKKRILYTHIYIVYNFFFFIFNISSACGQKDVKILVCTGL